jgi:hypothetical protein
MTQNKVIFMFVALPWLGLELRIRFVYLMTMPDQIEYCNKLIHLSEIIILRETLCDSLLIS